MHVDSVLPQGGTFQVRRLVDNNQPYDNDKDLIEEDSDDDVDNVRDVDGDVAIYDSAAAT